MGMFTYKRINDFNKKKDIRVKVCDMKKRSGVEISVKIRI